METKTFIESLKFVAHAQAVRDIRYSLNGVLFEFDERSLHLVGTDGRRMAVAQLEYAGDVRGQFIAPTESVKQIISAFKAGKKGEITFNADGTKLELTHNGAGVSFTATDGRFPDWRRVAVPADRVPGAFPPGVDPEYLASACKALAPLCADTGKGARPLTINANGTEALRAHPVALDLAGLSQAFAIIMPLRP